jgi:hypothetical protein
MRIGSPTARDIGFPTSSRGLSSSGATHGAPDYTAVHVVLRTDAGEALEAHGLTFTSGPLRHPAFSLVPARASVPHCATRAR